MIAGPHGASDWIYLAGVPILAGGAAWELYSRNLAGPVLLDLAGVAVEATVEGAGLVMLGIGCFDLFLGRLFMGFFYICFSSWTLLSATRRSKFVKPESSDGNALPLGGYRKVLPRPRRWRAQASRQGLDSNPSARTF